MDHLKACIDSAVAGGRAIENHAPSAAESKDDKYVGSHAIVTDADFRSQEAILRVLDSHDKDSFFVTEEHVREENFRRRILSAGAIERMRSAGVYIIDELDGSSTFQKGHYEWATSVGFVEKMSHVAGAVFAPKISKGLFSAAKGEGAFAQKARMQIGSCRNLKDAYVLAGPDNVLTKYPAHNRLLTMLGDATRTFNSNGSCALAMGLVAAGRADALVQPLQSPWDWAAGKLLVEEAGGVVLFYEMEKDAAGRFTKILPVSRLEPRHYDPDTRAVGLVAGNETIAAEIMEMLLKLSR